MSLQGPGAQRTPSQSRSLAQLLPHVAEKNSVLVLQTKELNLKSHVYLKEAEVLTFGGDSLQNSLKSEQVQKNKGL